MSYFTSVEDFVSSCTQKGDSYNSEVKAFTFRIRNAGISEIANIIAANVVRMANANGYSQVYARILLAMEDTMYKASVSGNAVSRSDVEELVEGVYTYFLEGTLNSSSASSSSAIANIQENAQRDGVLRALKDIRFEFGF